jgi:hypothetical protein
VLLEKSEEIAASRGLASSSGAGSDFAGVEAGRLPALPEVLLQLVTHSALDSASLPLRPISSAEFAAT